MYPTRLASCPPGPTLAHQRLFSGCAWDSGCDRPLFFDAGRWWSEVVGPREAKRGEWERERFLAIPNSSNTHTSFVENGKGGKGGGERARKERMRVPERELGSKIAGRGAHLEHLECSH